MTKPKHFVSVVKVWSTDKGRELLRLNPDDTVTVTPSSLNEDELDQMAKAAAEVVLEIQQRTGKTTG